jgi:hypothetical protein
MYCVLCLCFVVRLCGQLDNNQDLIDSMLRAERYYQPNAWYVSATAPIKQPHHHHHHQQHTASAAAHYTPAPIQTELDAHMRKILFDWMAEVCLGILCLHSLTHELLLCCGDLCGVQVSQEFSLGRETVHLAYNYVVSVCFVCHSFIVYCLFV